jgi:hypothetical protein
MDVPATGASLSGGARCAVSGIPTIREDDNFRPENFII